MSVRHAVRAAAAALAEAGVASPRVDAELLAAFVLGTSRAALVTAGDFTPEQRERFDALTAERVRRVPLQHLTGRAPFRYLELAVGPGVFVPRPETEQIVQWGLDAVASLEDPVVVDLCAGSGAVALALAQELPVAQVYAVEHDELAFAWLRRNAADRVEAGDAPTATVRADATAPDTLSELDGGVDLVLSNPPYVPLGSVVAPEAAAHDPPVALWGGPDGFDVVRGVIATAGRLLRPGGLFGFEHGEAQAGLARRCLDGWDDVAHHPDLAGRPRFTVARRGGPA